MAGTLVKSVMLKITASDGDTEAKLDQISAKAKELAAQHPDLTPKINSAAVSAKLAVLRTELKSTANAADGDSTSLKSRLMGLGGAASSITGLGDAFAVANPEASTFQKAMAGMSLATGLLEPALAGGVVAVAGLGSGVAAAGVGAGIFGLVAKQAFSTVSTNITSATKAYEQLSTAQTKAQKTAGLEAWKKSLAGLDEGQRTLVIDTAKAGVTWDNFVKNSTAGIAQTLAPALALLPKALSFANEFLGPVEAALQDVIIDVKQAMSSPFWKSTISEWAATSGPMIEDIAVAIGHVIHGVVGILNAFMPMSTSLGSGLDSLTAKFAKWGETLSGHTGFQSLISMAKTEAPMAIGVLKNLATVLLNVGKAMTGMDGVGNSKTLLQILQPLSGVLASLSKNQDLDRIALYLLAGADAGKKLSNTFKGISSSLKLVTGGASNVSNLVKGFKDADAAADEATGKWGTFGGKISGLGDLLKTAATKMGLLRVATVEGTEAQEGMDVAMEANPIGLIVVAIVALVAIIVLAYIHFKTFRDIVNDVGRALKTGFLAAVHAVEVAAKAVASFVVSAWNGIWDTTKTVWNGIKTAVSTAINAVETGVKTAFNAVVSVVKGAWNDVKSATNTVWGWIKSFINTEVTGVKNILNWFGQLGSLFEGWWNKGLDAVKSVAGNLVSFVRGIPGKILSALGNMGNLLVSAGKDVMQGLLNGLKSMLGPLASAAANIGHTLLSAAKSAMGIGSPSRIAHWQGQMYGLGLVNGLGSMTGQTGTAGHKLGQTLAAGLESSTSTVAASAHKVAGAATITGGAASAASMASSVNGMSLQVQGGGGSQFNQFMATWIKNYVRVNFGGNVQKAFGH